MAKRCTLSNFGEHDAESDSSSKVYKVVIREDGRNTCTCPAWAIKKNKLGGNKMIGDPECTCKHIKRIQQDAGGCGWNTENGQAQTYPDVCPACDSPTVEYTPPGPPPDDEDMAAAAEKLLAMRNRLSASA